MATAEIAGADRGCEVFSGTSSVGACDFDDIEFALFEPGEKYYWK